MTLSPITSLPITRRKASLVLASLTAACMLPLGATSSAQDTQAQRIVSIGGSVSEIVYALGEEDRLVAVDTTSIYPSAARELPSVGYMRQLAAEGVLALNPDLILAITGSGPQQTIEVLKAGAVPYAEVPEGYSEEAVLAKVNAVAKALGVSDKAGALKAKIAADFKTTREAIEGANSHPRVMFLLSAGGGRLMAAGTHSAADAVIRLAGGANAFGEFEGYKPINAEALVAAAPDYIIAMERPGVHPIEEIRKLPGLELTPAGAGSDRLIPVDGQALLGFGPRTATSLLRLSKDLGIIAD
ncbi:ABC transporter substrate-binding protein [Breoghania sp.]|uniref:heme/hemin ABC transporter substrate-binding protein n=1 Tax=Breoghania sp. TaxID=2065378 RepID=UPI002AA8E872|nr:ABC transporter substrate-binding protein [Breoghania sp.]